MAARGPAAAAAAAALLLLLCSGLAGRVEARRAGAGAEGSQEEGAQEVPQKRDWGAPGFPGAVREGGSQRGGAGPSTLASGNKKGSFKFSFKAS